MPVQVGPLEWRRAAVLRYKRNRLCRMGAMRRGMGDHLAAKGNTQQPQRVKRENESDRTPSIASAAAAAAAARAGCCDAQRCGNRCGRRILNGPLRRRWRGMIACARRSAAAANGPRNELRPVSCGCGKRSLLRFSRRERRRGDARFSGCFGEKRHKAAFQ